MGGMHARLSSRKVMAGLCVSILLSMALGAEQEMLSDLCMFCCSRRAALMQSSEQAA